MSKRQFSGTGTAQTGNSGPFEVKYDLRITFGSNGKSIKITGGITSPQTVINQIERATGTLTLRDGEQVDALFKANGDISPLNLGSAIRGFEQQTK